MTLALDVILKSILNSSQFHNTSEKDWAAIARLVPGTTPKQCQKRYDELLQQHLNQGGGGSPSVLGVPIAPRLPARTESSSGENKASRPPSAKNKGAKQDRELSTSKGDNKRPTSAENSAAKAVIQAYTHTRKPKYKVCHERPRWKQEPSPIMVIHVCDEAKNLKQDFHCPRDLLVCEMKYFAEYLSTDAQRWEDVDISVHCDVQIFDWLMKYVKRHTRDVPIAPKLEPNNVISILISSDFLKMDSLVNECVQYCHANMNNIIATPCNMNCINDRLCSKIADLFNQNEADEIRDRKDKFKSKLFAKKIEMLFDPDRANLDSPESAVTLYRCGICQKLLTQNLETKIKCSPSRLTIDRRGQLVYSHVRDTTWDVNDFLLELKSQLKTWCEVYWRLWGTINALTCSRCGETFPCAELGHCRYHPESPDFDALQPGVPPSATGMYPCCNTRTLRFDPTQPNTGCNVRDHVVHLEGANDSECNDDEKPIVKNTVYEDLLSHRAMVTVLYEQSPPPTDDEQELNVFGKDEALSKSGSAIAAKASKSDSNLLASNNKNEVRPQPRLQALTVEREVVEQEDIGVGESEDEFGDEEEGRVRKARPLRRSRVTVDPQAILMDAPDFSTVKNRKWDSSRSLRWNQDAQREEDQRRMNFIVNYLTRLRLNNEKLDRLRQREYAGGLFAKLESQWKSVHNPPPKAAGPLTRTKTRLTAMKL